MLEYISVDQYVREVERSVGRKLFDVGVSGPCESAVLVEFGMGMSRNLFAVFRRELTEFLDRGYATHSERVYAYHVDYIDEICDLARPCRFVSNA